MYCTLCTCSCAGGKNQISFSMAIGNNNTILHFIETRLQYNWHSNKNGDGSVNNLASNLVILNQAHRVAWLIRQE